MTIEQSYFCVCVGVQIHLIPTVELIIFTVVPHKRQNALKEPGGLQRSSVCPPPSLCRALAVSVEEADSCECVRRKKRLRNPLNLEGDKHKQAIYLGNLQPPSAPRAKPAGS